MLLALLPLLLAQAPSTVGEPGPEAETLSRDGLAATYGERWTAEARVYLAAGPSVVSVDVYSKLLATALPNPTDLLGPLGEPLSQGSGVVIDRRGFVITNAHVALPNDDLEPNQVQIVLSFADDFGGAKVPARLVNLDREWDLALLKIDSVETFPHLPLGTTDDVLIGEKVIAIGTAYGNSHSLTSGILSGVARRVPVEAPDGSTQVLSGLLQTDAAMNPGNSGGPLLNVFGELIGINSATLEVADGIGYAIPVDRVREIMRERLLEPRVWLGIQMRRDSGLTIGAVHPRGPGATAGLESGDRIVAIDREPVLNRAEFQQELLLRGPGETVEFQVERGDRRRTASMELQGIQLRDSFGLLGFTCQRDFIWVGGANGVPTQYPVLRLTEVFPDSGAAALGLEAGDAIIAVHLRQQTEGDGWVPVNSMEQLVSLINGPDFDFFDMNLWWLKPDQASQKGRLTFDEPTVVERLSTL
jgi:serine protease Do